MTSPRILIIAGSDSGGGAGIQADIKTVTMLGGHAMTAITALTAQNTLGVESVMLVPADFVVAQMRACLDDIGVDAVKIGMIGSDETAHAVAEVLEQLSPSPSGEGLGVGPENRNQKLPTPTPPVGPHQSTTLMGSPKGRGESVPIVFDPVMVATSGAVLADADTIAAFARLACVATVTTPNLPEFAALQQNGAMGGAVLIKGGHDEGDTIVDRLMIDGAEAARWEGSRIATESTHGTGCTLASAIAVGLARGAALTDAIAAARRFVRASLERAPGLGQGHGPMGQQFVTGVDA